MNDLARRFQRLSILQIVLKRRLDALNRPPESVVDTLVTAGLRAMAAGDRRAGEK